MTDETLHPALAALRRRLEDEEAAYAEALAALDRLAAIPLPEESGPEVRGLLEELNGLWPSAPPPEGRGVGATLDRRVRDALSPVIERQSRFNAVLVRLLNAHLEHAARHHARERELRDALVRYAQRVEPVMDARDDMRVARAPTRAEQVLEAFSRRLDEMGRRLDGLLALRDRVEVLSEEVGAVRASIAAAPPAPDAARAAERAAADSAYTAFENRFRGTRDEVRARQADYVALLADHAPVLDLGCGRGEVLDLLRAAGVEARGVETSAHAVRECRARGLDVVEADVVAHLRGLEPGALGAVFAAQVVEHLPPAALQALLAGAHRALRPGGLLVLETVNAASALAFLDVYIRDLTHERPLHPETLRFLAAAAGFSDARIEWRSPVPEDVRLHLLPGGGLPPPVVRALNENVERLNALLFAPLDYALVARR
ncbi:MAG TPA: class I SAM-dependent methyltransferase [Vicinamibacteria bacterium]